MTYLTDGFFSTNGEFLLVDRFPSGFVTQSIRSRSIKKKRVEYNYSNAKVQNFYLF